MHFSIIFWYFFKVVKNLGSAESPMIGIGTFWIQILYRLVTTVVPSIESIEYEVRVITVEFCAKGPAFKKSTLYHFG